MISGTYRLIDGVETPQRIRVVRTQNGKSLYTTARLIPNEVYILEDDERFLNSLKAAKVKRPYSDSLRKALENHDVPFEIENCMSCGGRVKKLVYCIVEVKEDGTT